MRSTHLPVRANPQPSALLAAAAARRLFDVPIVFVREGNLTPLLKLLMQDSAWQVRPFSCAQEVLAHRATELPTCVILDAVRHGRAAVQLQEQLAERTDLPTIFIGADGDVATAVRAMKAGAFEFLLWPFTDGALRAAIGGALERSRIALQRDSELRSCRQDYACLTPRERDVMALVISGLLNKQVAWELGISEITVKAHRGQVMRKMKAGSLADLVIMSSRLGMIRRPMLAPPATDLVRAS